MCRSCRSSRTASIRIWSPSGSSTYRSGCARRSTRPGSPSSSPANSSAARRLPTPGGPWKRYACAGPSLSAAASSRAAPVCSGKVIAHLLGDLLRRARRVERDDPAREDRSELRIRGPHRVLEALALALDAIRSFLLPTRGLVRVEHEQEGAVGEDPADRVHVQREHLVDAEPASEPLVGERGVEVAVADHVCPTLEGRADHLRDELGPGRGEQSRLRPRRNLAALEEQVAYALSELRPAGLTRRHDLTPVLGEVLPQQVDLGRLARPVEPLERHEHRCLGYEPCERWSPGERGSSGRTSRTPCSRGATRWRSSTTSLTGNARTC